MLAMQDLSRIYNVMECGLKLAMWDLSPMYNVMECGRNQGNMIHKRQYLSCLGRKIVLVAYLTAETTDALLCWQCGTFLETTFYLAPLR